MEFQVITSRFEEARVEAIAAVVFKGDKLTGQFLKTVNTITGGQVAAAYRSGEFKADSSDNALFRITPKGRIKARYLLLLGVGSIDEFQSPDVAKAAGRAVRFLREKNVKSIAFLPRVVGDDVTAAQNAAQGAITGQFELDKYKTADKNGKAIEKFSVYLENSKQSDVKRGIDRGRVIGEAMNFARDLANEPPNILTPTEMANRAVKMAKEAGLKCEILDEAKMKRLGMGSLLSVSAGSEQPAKLIVLNYTPAKRPTAKGKMLALVGKGITFDTGGISLKPGENMDAMKYDMSGGATVLGTMRAIARLKPDFPVLGIVAAVENMPDGRATRPSDVVTAMNGKTIEILNTDAEGRLILADAVAYAEKLGATHIVDMATLTGAVIIALGEFNTGIMGNDQELVDAIIQNGKMCGEGFWQLPVGKDYSKQIKSDIADIKNIGPKLKAGTIMGAVFIQEFVDKAKWAHLDIAGTAWADSAKPHQAKGPTGVAIRTLIRLIEDHR